MLMPSFVVLMVTVALALANLTSAQAQNITVAQVPAAMQTPTVYATVTLGSPVRRMAPSGTATAQFGALAVRVFSPDGKPAPANVDVEFVCAQLTRMSCFLGSAASGDVHVKTDSHGIATLKVAAGRMTESAASEGQALVNVTGPAIVKSSAFQLVISR